MTSVTIDEDYLDVLEATKERARAMESAVKDLIFWAGELPAKDTTAHREFREAYTVAANFFRDSFLTATKPEPCRGDARNGASPSPLRRCEECHGQNVSDDGPIIHAATCSADETDHVRACSAVPAQEVASQDLTGSADVKAREAEPRTPSGEEKVGCEGADGLLRIHGESERCDVCAPPEKEAPPITHCGCGLSFTGHAADSCVNANCIYRKSAEKDDSRG